MNNNKTKNPRAWRSLFLLSALSVLLFGSCSNDTDAVTEEIALTTPVVELGGVEASASRAAGTWNEMVSYANLELYMQDEQRAQVGDEAYYEYNNGSSWSYYDDPATVKGGPGSYRAGIKANIYLKKNESTGMPEIRLARYGYRGAIEVKADGSFAPKGALQPLSSAVQWKLKDANGNYIDPTERVGENAYPNYFYYSIRPVGLAYMYDFTNGIDGKVFPNGTADPVPDASNYSAFLYEEIAYADYTPGTYPATWSENQFETSDAPTAAWPLAEVVYCKDGFEWNYGADSFEPKGESTTWTVSYPAQLTLESGKLYTFNITLGKDAHITLDAQNAVSIAPWGQGEQIEVGKYQP